MGDTDKMGDNGRDELGRFTQGNDYEFAPGQSGNPGGAALTSGGGERAIKRLADGGPLAGAALELKEQLHQEIEKRGLLEVMRERAERYQAIADLFYGLCLGCQDAETLDKRVKRYGWLASKGFAMLAQLRELEKARGGGGMVIDAMEAAKAARDDEQH